MSMHKQQKRPKVAQRNTSPYNYLFKLASTSTIDLHQHSVAMTLLLTVLGAVLCSFSVSAQVVPQADFNIQGMAGKWYLIGFATNAQWFVNRKADMKMGTAIVNDMSMVDVKYDEYALTHTIKTKGSDPTVVTKLYGRGVELSADLLERFRQFSLGTGVLPENIAFLPKNAECPAA
ncbi:hypothetical protein F7725_006744 [Dissostichus mawsoni]|uniref:Lipocalin/cytosolic fatty-acid binding domain-containing protein n=1 Tax=Dissostichus mawsoni TaxID=36200 RepID=A0A7J5XUT8_DISMA|nr:hypothetical protein F7725_006744 [Dissostichus mawsoni]